MSYATISDFGKGANTQSNPLALCATSTLDSNFNNTLGGNNISGPGNQQCQIFMAGYCAGNWDGVCEYMSKDQARVSPTIVQSWYGPQGNYLTALGIGSNLTKGQLLIRNTAAEKYLKSMSANCKRHYEPFDPTVADSPLVSRWIPSGYSSDCKTDEYLFSSMCKPVYGVDPETIDNDIVMDKILQQPDIALDILVNIYNTAVANGDIKKLLNKKIGKLFVDPTFQKVAKSGLFAYNN